MKQEENFYEPELTGICLNIFFWFCEFGFTEAGVGPVWVHFVSRFAGADEACAVQVGALMLTQFFLTVSILTKICTKHNIKHLLLILIQLMSRVHEPIWFPLTN